MSEQGHAVYASEVCEADGCKDTAMFVVIDRAGTAVSVCPLHFSEMGYMVTQTLVAAEEAKVAEAKRVPEPEHRTSGGVKDRYAMAGYL